MTSLKVDGKQAFSLRLGSCCQRGPLAGLTAVSAGELPIRNGEAASLSMGPLPHLEAPRPIWIANLRGCGMLTGTQFSVSPAALGPCKRIFPFIPLSGLRR